MTVTTWTLTGDVSTMVGDDWPVTGSTAAEAYLTAYNADGPCRFYVDTSTGGKVRFGPTIPVTLASDGTFTVAGIPDSSETGLSYSFTLTYRPAGHGRTRAETTDRFTLDANKALNQVGFVNPDFSDAVILSQAVDAVVGPLITGGALTNAALNVAHARVVAPEPTGVTATDTAQLLASYAAAVAAGARQVTLRAGTYVVNQPLPLSTGVVWVGQGRTATTIKVADGANCSVFRSDNFAALTGTSVTALTSAPYAFGVESLAIDGNKANQTGTSWGVQAYGHSFHMDEVHVRNCLSGGLYSEFSFTGSIATDIGLPSYEPRISAVDIHHCDGWGWRHRGPTDLLASRVLVWKCGLAGGAGGIWVQSGNGASLSQCHTFGNVGWALIADAQIFATGCQIETGEAGAGTTDVGGVWLRFDDCSFVGGAIYRITAGGVPTDGVGLRLGNSATGAYATRAFVNTNILGFTGADAAHAALHFSADSNSTVYATLGMGHPSGAASATTPITGTPDTASRLQINVTGSSAVKGLHQNDHGYVGVKAQRTSDQTIGTGAFASVALTGTDAWDTHAFHDPAGTSERITIPTGAQGRYRLSATFSWDQASSVGRRAIRIRKNGSTILVRDDRAAVSGGPTTQSVTVDDEAAAADYYELQVFQDSGGNLPSNVALGPVNLSVERLGP